MPDKTNNDRFFAAWPTAWGPMGAVAGDRGIRRVVLPHYQLKDLKDLLAWEHPGTVEDEGPFEAFVEQSRSYFSGRAADFSGVEVDLPPETAFFGIVYRACRAIPAGRTVSYSGLAREIGRPDAARAVATALSKNPTPLVVPCHRVTYANGEMGGFSAPGGIDQKRRMIALESRGQG